MFNSHSRSSYCDSVCIYVQCRCDVINVHSAGYHQRMTFRARGRVSSVIHRCRCGVRQPERNMPILKQALFVFTRIIIRPFVKYRCHVIGAIITLQYTRRCIRSTPHLTSEVASDNGMELPGEVVPIRPLAAYELLPTPSTRLGHEHIDRRVAHSFSIESYFLHQPHFHDGNELNNAWQC